MNFETVVREAMDSFWVIDARSGRVVDTNISYCKISGYERDEIIGRKITDFEVLDSEIEILNRINRVFENSSYSFLASHKTKSGDIVKFEVCANLITQEDGVFIVEFLRDVNALVTKEVYDAVSATLKANNISAWKWDMLRDKLEWDDITYEMLGFGAKSFEVNYQKWRSMLHPDDSERVEYEIKEQLLLGDSFMVEFRLKKADGGWMWLEGRGKVIKYDINDKPMLMAGTLSCIDARKETEAQLAQNQEKLQMLNTQLMELVKLETKKRVSKEVALSSIFEVFGTGILILDGAGNIVDANMQFLELYDIKNKDEILGTPYVWLLDENERESAQLRLDEIIFDIREGSCENLVSERSCKSSGQYEVTLKLKSGRSIDVLVNTSCFKIDHKSINFVFSITDITTMRELEKRQKESEKLLIAQSRMAAMGEMIGAIAHQWRQPLNILAILVQDVPFSYESGNINEQYVNKFSDDAMEQIYFMSKTIDDFRSFFRSDKVAVDFSLAEQVNGSLHLVSDMFRAHGIHIEISQNANPIVVGYPNEFSQVILNMAANSKDAFEYAGINGLRVLKVDIYEDGGYGAVVVSDNAGGVAEDIIDRIFEPYFTTKPEGKGTGIGLYMSKNIISNMNGTLTVKNRDNGASFEIKIPLLKEKK